MQELRAGDPRQIGGYRVLGRIGAGGMGEVFLGRSRGGRSVAVKVVSRGAADDPGFRARFAREVRAARQVSGPGTVPVVDADPEAELPWYASDYVPGPSLAVAVSQHGALPVGSVWRLAAGLAETLAQIHGQGLIHRDVKPHNLLLSASGPRLIDFGIARASATGGLTMTGARLGTEGYMSPEQWAGERVTPATDVYSYGLLLAFAATGQNPRPGVALRLDELPMELAQLIRACLAERPEDRPDAADLHTWARRLDRDGDAWLPESVLTVIARTSEQLLNLAAEADDEDPRDWAEPRPDPDGPWDRTTRGARGHGHLPTSPDTPTPPGPPGGWGAAFHAAPTGRAAAGAGPHTPPPSAPPGGGYPAVGAPAGGYGYPPPGTPYPPPGGSGGSVPAGPTGTGPWPGGPAGGAAPMVAPWVRDGLPGKPVIAVIPLLFILLELSAALGDRSFWVGVVLAGALNVVLFGWALGLHFAGRRLTFAPAVPAVLSWCGQVLSFWVLMTLGMLLSGLVLSTVGTEGRFGLVLSWLTLLAMIYVLPASFARRRRWRTEPVVWGG
ncbi:serine/threonine-protein kinase [Streptomyces sp. DSM 44915]|uniref:Serine/threonine-protein kinase n=1 Tax=Streptomyces chisholmiae TaxID=3075540 RepID=A0ABU2JPR0_9ACTN|nr:serine/threonine-protein kinase [Streptomyces sp. DSM 44915]MDT0266973.1 serine/threonine-protein kinase [Streptomyces sp. DSM 44915]